jgi:NAD(P)-dependent dehydrogenase (short-subunit alcohol dehydrogenase family)
LIYEQDDGLLPEAGSRAYVAAKHGVIGHDGSYEGIRVNELAPRWVRTPMTKGWDEDKGLNAQMKAAAPNASGR